MQLARLRGIGAAWKFVSLLFVCASFALTSSGAESPIVTSEFIYETAPFPSCHASTIVEQEGALVAAWFGGTEEGADDVAIWCSRRESAGWTKPVSVANGVVPGDKQHPCWNPVLFQPSGAPLILFYKVGPNPRQWWGMWMESTDGGKSWSKPQRLPEGILGPIRAKPIESGQGRWLCGSSTEHAGWKVHVEWSADAGRNWTKSGSLNDPEKFAAIQPTILDWPGSKMQLLCRTRQKIVSQLWSEDDGQTWGPMEATELPNPSAGIDAVLLRDGRALLIYNHTERGRSPLNLATSKDGRHWQMAFALETEPGEYSYPALIQTKDGRVHASYTWKRRLIKHVELDPAKL